MPPLPRAVSLQRRSEASAKTFSIIFAVIAVVLIIICLVWGFVLPRYRKRKKPELNPLHRGGGTNSSGSNDAHHFPSHPAVLRGFRSKQRPVLDRYNPRTESPFPQNGPLPEYAPPVPFLTSHPLSNSLYGPGNSHGLFSPTKSCIQPRQGMMLQNETSKPQGKAKCAKEVEVTAYEQCQDYILPVPEPLVLKPRPAGRPPPLTRQLERFPIPIGTLKPKDNLLHPAKLFEGVESRDSQSTADTVGTPCPPQYQVRRMNLPTADTSLRNNDAVDLDELSERTARLRGRSQGKERKAMVASIQGKPTLRRAGTVTRPRTPVAEMRERFNQNTINVPANGTTSRTDNCTPSVNPFDTPGDSSTPPTSPRYSYNFRVPSRAQFPGRHAYPENKGTNMEQPEIARIPSWPPGFQTAVPNASSELGNDSGSTADRFQPARLNLNPFSNLRSGGRYAKGRSLSSRSTAFRPMMVPRSYRSHRASSVYSRDTRGMSTLPSPTHDEIMQYQAVQPSSFIDERNTMLMNNVKSKIDEWDLHTADLDVSALSPPRLKRTLSDCGPRGSIPRDYPGLGSVRPLWIARPTYNNTEHHPRSQIEHDSFDMFNKTLNGVGSGCRDHVAHPAKAGGKKPITDGGFGDATGTAPGGVAWI